MASLGSILSSLKEFMGNKKMPNTALHLSLIPLRFIRANELGR